MRENQDMMGTNESRATTVIAALALAFVACGVWNKIKAKQKTDSSARA